jgi:MoaA/NifB/PqqE/SkfB family radical SAM enzyme
MQPAVRTVSFGHQVGQSMWYDDITSVLIPRLKACRVERVTLTGGEPTIRPRFTAIVQVLRAAGMQVGFCTNATTLTDTQVSELAGVGGVHANVSLDGFRAESHGRFRGERGSFAVTVATVRNHTRASILEPEVSALGNERNASRLLLRVRPCSAVPVSSATGPFVR